MFRFTTRRLTITGLLIVSMSVGSVATAASPAALASAAAAGELVLKAIGGLSSWIASQADDCAAAALAHMSGKHCNTEEEAAKDTGFTFASAFAPAEPSKNDCARAFGRGFASESLFGSWAGATIDPGAFAIAFPLHDDVESDWHFGKGFGTASVDGTVRSKTQSTPSPTILQDTGADVFAEIRLSQLSLIAGAPSTVGSTAQWRISAAIDGKQIFYSAATLAQDGTLAVDGDIDRSLLIPTFNSVDQTWEVSLPSFSREIFLAHLNPGEEVDFQVNFGGDMNANASLAIPEPSSVVLISTGLLSVLIYSWRRRDRLSSTTVVDGYFRS